MPAFQSPHQVYCYTGIHSIAAAIAVRARLKSSVQIHLSSQPAIIADLRSLCGTWEQQNRQGLETVVVLGPLANQNVVNDTGTPSIVALLDTLAEAGVRVVLCNEYAPLKSFSETSVKTYLASKPTDKNPGNPMLIVTILQEFAPQKNTGNNALPKILTDLQTVLKEHELRPVALAKRDPLLLALEWAYVECIQYRETAEIAQIVEELGCLTGTQELPKLWDTRAKIQGERGRGVLIGDGYKDALHLARLVAQSELPVIVLGETGSGKELMARRIHDASRRSEKPFVAESCANFTESLFEATLFGTIKGAYTGALDRQGLLEAAEGGTLFLDEIAELSPINQGKLLRVLQEKCFHRLGEYTLMPANVRVIAATNEDLYALARKGKFRLDLWYRLAGEVINLPALRTIPNDLHKIANHLLIQLCNEDNELLERNRQHEDAQRPLRLLPEDTECLKEHTWPGNVRELRLAIHRHLATGKPLKDIVHEYAARERAFDEKHSTLPELMITPAPLQTSSAFVVKEITTIRSLKVDYTQWMRKMNPKMIQKALAKKLGIDEETLSKYLEPNEEKTGNKPE